jgi:hypothetical protein
MPASPTIGVRHRFAKQLDREAHYCLSELTLCQLWHVGTEEWLVIFWLAVGVLSCTAESGPSAVADHA